jgi:hypothetical protein
MKNTSVNFLVSNNIFKYKFFPFKQCKEKTQEELNLKATNTLINRTFDSPIYLK